MALRLDTPLSRALLDAGKIDPSALEDAIQQQLVHGGALDTLLLELGLVDEPTLARLLAQAWQSAAVEPARFDAPALDAVATLPERMAVAMRTCPLFIDDAGLHVLVTAPLDKALIGELAGVLGRLVIPHVVPEVRVWQALARAYGVAPDERFVSLMASVSGGAPRKVTPRLADEPPSADGDLAPATWDLVEAFAHLAAAESRDGVIQVAVRFARKSLPFAALVGVRPQKHGSSTGAVCQGWLRSGPCEGAQFLHAPFTVLPDCVLATLLDSPAPFVGPPDGTLGNAAMFGWLGRRRPRTFVAVPIVVGGRAVAVLVGDGGVRARETHTLADVVSFAARLGPAFEGLLRQRHNQHPSLFPRAPNPALAAPPMPPMPPSPPTGEHLIARMPPPADVVREAGRGSQGDAVPAPPPAPPRPSPRPITITMPAIETGDGRDGTSPFARAYVPSPKSEPPHKADELPPPPPPAAPLELPVASSLAEALPRLTQIQAPAALQSFSQLDDRSAPRAWNHALSETVARGHQGGTVPAESRPRGFLDDQGWEDVVLDAAYAADLGQRRPAPVIALPSLVEDLSGAANATRPMPAEPAAPVRLQIAPPTADAGGASVEEMVDELAGLDTERVRAAQHALAQRGSQVVPALAQRFPGRLRRDPFDPGVVSLEPADLSPLVELLAALGQAGLEAAIPHLDSRFPAHRFCAVLLFAYTPDERAIELLRSRLHDQEPRIQKLAADALAPFVAHPQFVSVLAHLRDRLSAPLVDARRRAVELLGAFRDVAAVPSLITLLDRTPDLAEDARQALRYIALQDHGVRGRGWERWWQKAKKKTRVDWLLEGLGSEDRELRSISILELSALAGNDFGFHPDGDKAARKTAQDALAGWWAEQRKQSA